jgi:hypothetical protein
MVRQKGGRKITSTNLISRLAPNAPSYNNWEVYLISAHGAGDPDVDPPPTVPENTYIIFGGPSGCELTDFTNGIPYETQITVPSHQTLIESMIGISGSGSLLTTSKRPINMSKFPTVPILESNVHLSSNEVGVSIYEPRTPYADMKLRFINNPGQTSMLGIYKLPLSRPFVENYKEWKKTNHTYMDNFLKGDSTSPSENIGITYTGTETTLDTILKDASIFPPSTKQRIIFVSACRGNYKDPANRAATLRLRALSEDEHNYENAPASSSSSAASSSSSSSISTVGTTGHGTFRKRTKRRKTRRRLRN